MMKLLLGGSPCTHWSIAQTKNRETEPEGLGWELFRNYLIAREKFQPDFFLYENNKSMAPAIRAQITRELGVEPILINSALVSAQNRQRLYWTNIPGVEQPEDRRILLRDILESGLPLKEKGYTLKANYSRASAVNALDGGHFPAPMAAEPVRIGTIESDSKNADFDSQQYRVYSPDGKSVTLCGQGGGVGAKTGLYAVPVRVDDMPNADGIIKGGQAHRVYDAGGKAVTLTARPNGGGVDGPLYAVLADVAIYQIPRGYNKGGIKYEKTPTLTASGDWAHNNFLIEVADGKTYPVYEVRDGQITIKGQQYPIKLPDGFYIIRKLTVRECMRLQTVPEDFVFPVSDTQAYKMLGNGWTVDVIAHILSYCPGITTEPLEVLSMYDGMSCGHLALDKLGAHIARYYATEIDKYAIKTTQHNFSDTIQLGDAFQVRADGWKLDTPKQEGDACMPYSAIPAELKEERAWVNVWNNSKMPMQASTRKAASSALPDTWSEYSAAVAAVERGQYDGLGYVFHDTDLVGIDIDAGFDGCFLSRLAVDIVGRCRSYTEKSRSGRGVHVLVRGRLPFKGRNNRAGVEIYQSGRYFIMTGKVLVYSEIIENQAAIDYVLETYFPDVSREGAGTPLSQRIYTPVYPKPAGGKIALRPEYLPILPGARNTSLTSLAGQLHNQGYGKGDIYRELLYCNEVACQPPLPRSEVEQIVGSVTRYRR